MAVSRPGPGRRPPPPARPHARDRRQTTREKGPMAAAPSVDAIRSALAGVEDPEIHRPITELGMVKDINVLDHGKVEIGVYLTVAGCPMKETITSRVTTAVSAV